MAQTLAEYWMQEGKAEDITQGIKQGVELGRKEGQLLAAKKLCAAKFDPTFIADTMQLSIQEVTKLWFEVEAESTAAELQQ